jgi:hypothetical protein
MMNKEELKYSEEKKEEKKRKRKKFGEEKYSLSGHKRETFSQCMGGA